MATEFDQRVDFEQRVIDGYYDKVLVTTSHEADRDQWRVERNHAAAQFLADAIKYTLDRGVPKKYAGKVVSKAWQEGHPHGYHEVLNCLYGLIEIFEAQP